MKPSAVLLALQLSIPVHATPGTLQVGDAIVLANPDGGRLVLTSSDDPKIRFFEVDGGDVTCRLSIHDDSRVVVLRPSEERTVRLRDLFADVALQNNDVMVEVLQGTGSVTVDATELQPKADAATTRRRAVQPPKPLPTSFALIDQAEAAGKLDSETALLYRVYSLFADARLPAQYRGNDAAIKDSLYMTEVRSRYSMLSPATQAAVEPFLIPPAYKESWANTPAGSHVIPLANTPRCQSFSDKWNFADAVKYPVRVWYNTDLTEAEYARAVATEIDNVIWPKLVGLMQSAPLSDANENCNGGDGRLDVYLVDLPLHLIGKAEASCSLSPAYIYVRRSAKKEDIAHEFFHTIQFSFPLKACLTDKDYDWWTEASAMWAEDFLYPDTQDEQAYAPSYLRVPTAALDTTDQAHEYGAYLLPFFIHRNSGSADFVRVAWQNCANEPALEAVDRAIPGGFEKVWPEFVKRNWNRDPIKDYKTWDKLTANVPGRQADFGGAPDESYSLQIDLPRLSATYYDFAFNDQVSSVVFWNGVANKLAIQEVDGPQYVIAAADADQTKGAHVTALVRLGGIWRVEDDWTGRPFVTFCRDKASERLEELVLIISNSEFKDRNRKLEPPGMQPLLEVSNIGCWRWQGSASVTGSGLSVSANDVTWTRDDSAASPMPFAIVYRGSGTVTFSVPPNPACSTTSGSAPIDNDLDNTRLMIINLSPPGNPRRRGYFGVGTSGETTICGDKAALPFFLSGFPLSGLDISNYVSADGKLIDGSTTTAGQSGPVTWKWHFQSKPE